MKHLIWEADRRYDLRVSNLLWYTCYILHSFGSHLNQNQIVSECSIPELIISKISLNFYPHTIWDLQPHVVIFVHLTLSLLRLTRLVFSVNYNNTSNRNSRVQEQAPSTPGTPGRRRFSSETVPKIFPYDELDVRKDYNKRESKIDRTCNKRLDYRHYRMDRRDSDSSRD